MAAGIIGAIAAAPQLISGITSLVDRFVPDPAQKAQAALELQKVITDERIAVAQAVADVSKAQSSVNAVEAQSDSLFKSGWRPAVGWACVVGFIYGIIVQPTATWAIKLLGVALAGADLPGPPPVDMVQITGLLGAMLGIGGLRTLEKFVPAK